ncbi:MAG: nucleoside-diphosphate sugar epimerase/dehydratase [Desulfobulbaceae bacterium]|nr:nucleoside-diphosphate sugar epimerase/dehydratase [Desulfobulbaceae bacterium]
MTRKFIKFLLLNRWSALVHDLFWIPVALALSYWLRFNLESIPDQFQQSLRMLIIIALPLQGGIFWYFGLYRGLWRFASIPDLVRIIKASFAGTLCLVGSSALVIRLEGVPRSIFFLYPLLLITGLSLSRISYRWYKDHQFSLRPENGTRTLIVGAGRAGEMLLRDLQYRDEYQPVAFFDDNVKLHNREIHGISVVGGIDDLGEIAPSLGGELVLIAIPSADKTILQRIVTQCNRIKIPYKTLPSLLEIPDGKVSVERLRPVTVEDLLGREVIEMNYGAVNAYLGDKVILVTGGGGSIGSELCRQIAALGPAKLIVFDNSEFNIYSIEQELRDDFPDLALEIILGDIKDADRITWVFSSFRPNVVFHAAAYKHVPMLEFNPAEGVRNNVIGTRVVADAADRFNAEHFVLISTDKAVNPTNIMGATKRIAELYCQNLDIISSTCFITARFGNVLGSAGSVVPLFKKQIANGGPITVTHPEISRYFMTIPESVSLILQAGAMGQGGEIFVLNMGKPVLIKDLAKQMIQLSGLKVDEDIKIVYTGLRPGEKLFEELLHESEALQDTSHEKLFLARSRRVEWMRLTDQLEKLQKAAVSRDVQQMLLLLHDIVPEFRQQVQWSIPFHNSPHPERRK